MEEFPPNSKASREKAVPQEKKIEPVVLTGEVVQKKKPFGQRFKEVFLGGELKGATRYIAADVLLPALRTMIVEATSRGIERMVYGESQTRRTGMSGRSRISYSTQASRYGSRGAPMLPDQPPLSVRRRQEVDDLILVSRDDAEAVLEGMATVLESFDAVSIADLHELVGLPSTHVDNKWGWTNINRAEVRQVHSGWLLDLPAVEPL